MIAGDSVNSCATVQAMLWDGDIEVWQETGPCGTIVAVGGSPPRMSSIIFRTARFFKSVNHKGHKHVSS